MDFIYESYLSFCRQMEGKRGDILLVERPFTIIENYFLNRGVILDKPTLEAYWENEWQSITFPVMNHKIYCLTERVPAWKVCPSPITINVLYLHLPSSLKVFIGKEALKRIQTLGIDY